MPTPFTILSGISQNYAIAVDDQYIYWSAFFGGTINRVLLTGGTNQVLQSGRSDPFDLVIDANNVYWTEDGSSVYQMPKAGGTVTNLGGSNAWHLTVDSSYVYWTEFTSPNGLIRRTPIGGGPITTIFSGQNYPYDLVVDATNVYWTESADYGNLPGSQGVHQAFKDGSGGHIQLVVETSGPTPIAVDATNVYWINSKSTRTTGVRSIPIGGGPITELTGPFDYPQQPEFVALNGNSLFFGNGASSVCQVDKNVGGLTVIATNPQGPIGIAVGAPDFVYWSNFGSGSNGSLESLLLPIYMLGNSTVSSSLTQSFPVSAGLTCDSLVSSSLSVDYATDATIVADSTTAASVTDTTGLLATVISDSLVTAPGLSDQYAINATPIGQANVTATLSLHVTPLTITSNGTSFTIYFNPALSVQQALNPGSYAISSLNTPAILGSQSDITSFPITLTSADNILKLQFVAGGPLISYTFPIGVYATLAELVAAINAVFIAKGAPVIALVVGNTIVFQTTSFGGGTYLAYGSVASGSTFDTPAHLNLAGASYIVPPNGALVSILGIEPITATLQSGSHATVLTPYTVQIPDGTFTVTDIGKYLEFFTTDNLETWVLITGVNGNTLTVGSPLNPNDPLNGSITWSETELIGVILLTTLQTNGAVYTITVNSLRTTVGAPFTPSGTCMAVSPQPTLVSAEALTDGQIVITFSTAMRQDFDLTDPGQYAIIGPTEVVVKRVQSMTPTQVALFTSGMGTETYTLTVNATGTPHDVAGNPISPTFNTAIFNGLAPLTSLSVFTDKGPIAKPPIALQSGVNATIVRPPLTTDLQPHADLTTLTLTGGALLPNMLGLYVQLTGSTINSGTYKITAVLSVTSVRVNANFHLPDVMNGSMDWSVIDQREGQIADDPSDVSVTVNGLGVIPTAVIGLLGQIVLPSAPSNGDSVLVNYSWINNPTVDLRRLNSMEFRLNSWNRDVGYLNNDSRHHYRYNNTLVVPSEYVPLDMQATLPQPEQRDLKYRAYERAYTPVLNDPNLLTLNNPIHKVAFPPMTRAINSVFVSYDATGLPENDPLAPWTRIGVGTTTVGGDQLTVTKTASGPVPTGQVLYWSRPIDLSFPSVYASTWDMFISSVPTLDGVFTGIVAGFSDTSRAIVIGYLNNGGTTQIGLLVAGGDDPSVLSSWAGGLDTAGNPTGLPVAFDWTTIHSYRVYRDTSGTIRVYIDGNVTPTLQLTEAQVPFLEELEAPFSGLQGSFFGSISRVAVNTSVWEFFRYNIIPTNPTQTVASVFVTFEGNVTPEVSTQPWTPIGSAGTETTLSSTYLILDSTSAADTPTEALVGLVGGDFRGYDRIEPLLQVSSDVVLDVAVQLRTFTHGITPNAVMAAVDDGQYLVQLCFFPDQSAPKVSYGGRSLPTAFTPTTWTSMGGQTAAIYGRTLRITDASVSDGLIYYIDDNAQISPTVSPARVASPTTDYMLEFRARVESFTADITTGFCGVNGDVYDGVRSVGIMLTTVSGVPNVAFHSEGVAIQSFPFNWNDQKFHTYRVVKSTGGNLVSLFIDTTFIGSLAYSSFEVPGGSQVGVVSFGSATPSTTGTLSVVDWDYCNCWRVLSSFNMYVGLWRGYDPNALTGYHFSLKGQGSAAQVNNNALGDGSVDFVALGVVIGDYLIIDAGPNKGQYQIASVTTNVLTITTTFPFGPTTAAYRIPAQTNWTAEHRYRVVRDPSGGVSVLLDTQTQPFMRVGYNSTDLPSSAVGVPRVINGGLPGIAFGAFDPTNISQTSWNYVKYGITKNPSASRIVPPHQVLNQRNVIASYERQLSNLPHTLTDFWSSSTGIPPEIAPDFLQNPSLVAYTLLNEGTPLVPSTQTFEVRRPTPVNIPIAPLNSPGAVLNSASFVINNGDFETTLFVPDDILYNSLNVLEVDTGDTGLIAPFTDRVSSLGTLSFQNEVCLSYDAATLPENDPTAATPWAFQADDPSHVQRSVFSGVLTFGTDSTGTRAIYRNNTPLPDAVSLTTQVTFRLKLLSDASFGLGDTQVRFGMSATNMSLAMGFVTMPTGERYLLVYDQKTLTVVGGRRFDFLDGQYHKYRVVRNPGAGTVSVFIDN